MNVRKYIVQGSFPGGKPHASVLLQAKQNNSIQMHSNSNAYRLDSSRLNLHGKGNPLPNDVRQKMESFFETDFLNVRIHTGPQAGSIGALAFTMGHNIYFANGQYNPHTSHGQRLLGHELTHVVQQRNGKVRNPFGNSTAVVNDPGLEAEAERMGILTTTIFSKTNLHIQRPIQRKASNPFPNIIGAINKTDVPFSTKNNILPTQHSSLLQMMFREELFTEKWKPEDKIGSLIAIPRTKSAGGHHFIPANWIDRLMGLVIQIYGSTGEAIKFFSNVRDLLGEETPMEISFYSLTMNETDPYPSLTGGKGLYQVLTKIRQDFREWGENIYTGDHDGDGGGSLIDIPQNPSTDLQQRLTNAANAIVDLFDKWIGRSSQKINVLFRGTMYVQGERGFFQPVQVKGWNEVTWLHLRAKILEGVQELNDR